MVNVRRAIAVQERLRGLVERRDRLGRVRRIAVDRDTRWPVET